MSDHKELAPSIAPLDPQALISRAIDRGVDVDTMERLVKLATDIRAIQARAEWYAAKARFQAACPAIKKTARAEIRTRTGGRFGYTYAPLDEIEATVQPHLGREGLSYSWIAPTMEAQRVGISCQLAHALGHEETSGVIWIPIEQGEGGSGASPAQRVGIALTYAKRYSLLAILGKTPEDDDDAQTQHGPGNGHQEEPTGRQDEPGQVPTISDAQGKRFWAIARQHGWKDDEVKALLSKHEIGSTSAIPVRVYEALCNALKGGTEPVAK